MPAPGPVSAPAPAPGDGLGAALDPAGLGPPVQVAYGVADTRMAAERWLGRGVGPVFLRDHIAVTNARLAGEPATFDHSSAFTQWGEVMLELFCVHHPSPVTQPAGLHHLAFFVDDVETAGAALAARGWPEILYGETATGNAFAMHDARHELGHLIEIYPRTSRLVAFYAMVADAARTFTGADPLRVL